MGLRCTGNSYLPLSHTQITQVGKYAKPDYESKPQDDSPKRSQNPLHCRVASLCFIVCAVFDKIVAGRGTLSVDNRRWLDVRSLSDLDPLPRLIQTRLGFDSAFVAAAVAHFAG